MGAGSEDIYPAKTPPTTTTAVQLCSYDIEEEEEEEEETQRENQKNFLCCTHVAYNSISYKPNFQHQPHSKIPI